jgi:hypothetical protein
MDKRCDTVLCALLPTVTYSSYTLPPEEYYDTGTGIFWDLLLLQNWCQSIFLRGGGHNMDG